VEKGKWLISWFKLIEKQKYEEVIHPIPFSEGE